MSAQHTARFPIETRATPGKMLGMSPTAFLRDYWQQRPLLIRRAFPDFIDPLQADDLGGLACEELALARIVNHDPRADRWTLRNGPFVEEDFATLPSSHWTLLVQDVDKWDADVAALLEHFAFIPSWRIDDVMVSYAERGGTVGAHVDQYDVFLIQGMGRRRWQIDANPRAPKAFRDDVELRLLREFTPSHDWILEPGDMLYLPPGIAHYGVAEDPCLTYSVGMRAPAMAEMLSDFSGFLAERMGEDQRYSDAGMTTARRAGEIDDSVIGKIKQALSDSLALEPKLLRRWWGCFITRYRMAHEIQPRPKPLGHAQFAKQIASGGSLLLNPWTRLAWSKDGRGAILFVAGESLACPRALATRLCQRQPFEPTELLALGNEALELLRALFNAGHLAFRRSRKRHDPR